MSGELSQVSHEVVSSIILKNDLSVLTPAQRVEYVAYRSRAVGLDPAAQPFILMESKDGKISLYATKEAAAQLNQLRSLSPTVLKEEFLLDNTVYKVTYRVKENGRETDDCGAVGLVKIKKGINGQPDEQIKLSPFEVADAMMKAHTKGKRRAILTHCGIGTNDMEDVPLVVPDHQSAPVKEEIKDTQATIKDVVQQAEAKHDEKKANGYAPEPPADDAWAGEIESITPEELPSGKACWAIRGKDGTVFKTDDKSIMEHADEASGIVRIKSKKTPKGNLVVTEIRNGK